jgi:hypothetical protein
MRAPHAPQLSLIVTQLLFCNIRLAKFDKSSHSLATLLLASVLLSPKVKRYKILYKVKYVSKWLRRMLNLGTRNGGEINAK